MKQKTLLLFQLFLLIFAFYVLLSYSGNQCLLVSLACLMGMFVLGKVETSVTEHCAASHRRNPLPYAGSWSGSLTLSGSPCH